MVSVCMSTYNGELYVEEQLNSILDQLSLTDEVIVSDDSSTDNTISIIQSLSDPRVKIYKDNKFKSPIYNLENAIKYSVGDTIILADQDDVWVPGRVKEILYELQTQDLVLTNAFIVDNELNKQEKTLFEILGSQKGIFKNISKNSYVGCCMAFNATLKEKILPFPPHLPMHDQWIGLIAEMFYKVKLLSTPSILYRRHELNASNTGNISSNSIAIKLKYRLQILIALFFYGISR